MLTSAYISTFLLRRRFRQYEALNGFISTSIPVPTQVGFMSSCDLSMLPPPLLSEYQLRLVGVVGS
jgi:hypothetical protein